jgi:geranylgeranyl pyrophosphate synthase
LLTQNIENSTELNTNYVCNLIEERLLSFCNDNYYQTILEASLQNHFRSGGERIRARLSYQFSKSLGLSFADSITIGCISELFHNASLVHDDLQDLDEERRGCETIWKKYGSDAAICLGDFLISAAYSCFGDLSENTNTSKLIKYTHEQIAEVIHGQITDLNQDKNQSLKNILAYENIVARKTGPLFSMTLALPLLATNRNNYVATADEVFKNFALSYQIIDDIKDFKKDQAKIGVKSGVNIITLLQKNKVSHPVQVACQKSLKHLNQSLEASSRLPLTCQNIIKNEINNIKSLILNR